MIKLNYGALRRALYLALRQVIFKDYKNNASEGDWWCRLDGDEFYIDDPRLFLAGLDDKTDHVYNASFQYYYTEDDYREELSADNVVLPTERLKWYKCNHSEIRFIKHKNLLVGHKIASGHVIQFDRLNPEFGLNTINIEVYSKYLHAYF